MNGVGECLTWIVDVVLVLYRTAAPNAVASRVGHIYAPLVSHHRTDHPNRVHRIVWKRVR